MPGLWDCHVHFSSASSGDGPGYLAWLQAHPATCGANLARGCWETIQAGYTSVRDVAGYGCEIAKAVEDVIKVLASGGIMSRDDDPNYAQFSPEELRVIVEEAERQGRIVAAHVHGKPGIINAINAGCKTLEHVSYGDEEVVKLMKEKKVLWIATRACIDYLIANSNEMEPESRRKVKALASAHKEAYELAIESGTDIALGTDGPPGVNFAKEIEAAVKCGMTNLQALRAATAMGPRSIGGMAKKSGQLKVGYDADVLALERNPIQDVSVLQNWACITHVWKAGRLLKGPGVRPWGEGGEWDPAYP
ncbi:putative amidohydrolase [Phaeomoniella chlamydospora]|uniref:Putative amidohydrolase n=1 Tax=Phaeomoniella chlamydospora TaxID=158046 RepID=A0A0G2EQF7_PHACM|nr:putative amidohydrolase [Phaeomoniella chlamydospora]